VTWLYVLLLVWLSLSLGFFIGAVWAGRGARQIYAQNDELRAGLHWVRSALGLTPGYRALVQYIDRLLGEEAA